MRSSDCQIDIHPASKAPSLKRSSAACLALLRIDKASRWVRLEMSLICCANVAGSLAWKPAPLLVSAR